MNNPLIHGENSFKPLSKLPTGIAPKMKKETSYIAGHSESGHHHVVQSEAPFDVFEDTEKQLLYLRLFEPAKVVHKKSFDIHETKELKPGIYVRSFATEYNPFTKVVQRIFD